MRTGLLTGAAAALALPLLLAATAGDAAAQIVISGNDNKAVLDNGVTRVVPNPAPDTATILDLSQSPPRVLAEVQVPHSVVGPPLSVALAPDERLALVTSNQRHDPNDPSKTLPDSRLSVIDLRASPPVVVATLETGRGPAGVSVNRAGTLALVANRNEGTVSVFRIADGKVEPAGKVEVGPANAGVSHVAFTPDGRHALATRDGDHMVSVLRIEGERVSKTDRDIGVGIRPYALAIASDGRFAVVGNIGRNSELANNGDANTVSVIDLSREPFRTVRTVTVGITPEGVQLSPDGRLLAVVLQNGSNKPRSSPFHGPSLVRLFRVEADLGLTPTGDVPVGAWSQGAAFSADGRTLLVQNMHDRDISVLRIDEAGRPTDTGTRIKVSGGPAAIRTAERPPAAR